AAFVHGQPLLELSCTLVAGAVLAWVALAQLPAWHDIQAASLAPHESPLAEVWAGQFEWRFTYPGRDEQLGTLDDLHVPYELVVPRGERVTLLLRSRDVIHSFFVPAFRLKQDVVPGMSIPVWFEAREEGEFELVCAELCGFGHYQMIGRVRV